MYTLITSYAAPGSEPLLVEGSDYPGGSRQFPSTCLVEDEDGTRALLSSPDCLVDGVRASTWTDASLSGAQLLLVPIGEGDCLVEDAASFVHTRSEDPLTASYMPEGLRCLPSPAGPPSYAEYLDATTPGAGAVESAEPSAVTCPPGCTGFVHLHVHSEYSAWDGHSTIRELVEAILAQGGRALSVTDHGTPAGHPELYVRCKEAGLKWIPGIEAYLQDDRRRRPKQVVELDEKGKERVRTDPEDVQEARYGYWHVNLYAYTDKGLRNLWAASTEANQTGKYDKKPRMDWEVLERFQEGLIATTGCLGGPVAKAILAGDEILARARLARLLEIFDDRLYIEIHADQIPDQIKVNKKLVQLSREFGVPMIAVTDSHYTHAHQKEAHRAWIRIQSHKTLDEEMDVFSGESSYHVATEQEVRAALAYLGQEVVDESVANTVALADRVDVGFPLSDEPPIFSRRGTREERVARDIELFDELTERGWQRKVSGRGLDEEACRARIKRERDLIVSRRLPGYYLITGDLTRYAKKNKVIVGAGRGSGAASYLAYLHDITEVDPIIAKLPFERFLTEERVEMPDFDLDFPESKRGFLQDYLRRRWGAEHVTRVGSHIRYQALETWNKTISVLRTTDEWGNTVEPITLDAFELVHATIKDYAATLAGGSVDWHAFWRLYEDKIGWVRERWPKVLALADQIWGRLRTYGKHASGLAISPDVPLTDLPLRLEKARKDDDAPDGDVDELVSEFDYRQLADMGLLKYDLLTLRTLDTVQMTIDLIRAEFGVEIDLYSWQEQYLDPMVWDDLCAGWTLGVFQLETRSGTRMTEEFKPRSLEDLSAVVALNRPGPKDSGLAATYMLRRFGREPVTYPDSRLKDDLEVSYGAIIYQEQVMAVAQKLAGYGLGEADSKIRKILGKKLKDKVAAAGQEFVARAVQFATDRDVAVSLWAQLENFAKYCLAPETRVHLAASGPHSDGTVTVADLHRRLHTPLHPPVVGRTRSGEEYVGPCVVCGATESKLWHRGACNACYVWRAKFLDPKRGLFGLSYYADGRVRPARILDVIESGHQQVWRVTLADGKSITATAGHRHLTDLGYVTVRDLKVGDRLVVDAGYEPPTPDESRQRMRLTRGDRQRVGEVSGAYDSDNFGYVDGGHASWRGWQDAHPRVCAQCDEREGRIECAHLDGDHTNNDWSNLAWLCASCHKRYDYARNHRVRRWQRGHRSEPVEVISIEAQGVTQTYDVVMEEPHNLVANGIITHNSFNKAHSYCYAMLGYWTAWLKTHYPVQFLVACLSTAKPKKGEDPLPSFLVEARRLGIAVLPPDINRSKALFSSEGRVIRFGLAKVKGLGVGTAQAIVAKQPYVDLQDVLDRSGATMGHLKPLGHAGALDSIYPHRRALEEQLLLIASKEADKCVDWERDHKDEAGRPCHFDWAGEVDPPGVWRGRQPNKVWVVKPPPARCDVKCRQFRRRPPLDPATVAPYTAREIRQIEMDMFGVWLSGTPFEDIDPELLRLGYRASQVMEGGYGSYPVPAVVTAMSRKTSKKDGTTRYARAGLYAQDGELDVVCWSKALDEYGDLLTRGELVSVVLTKKAPRFQGDTPLLVVEEVFPIRLAGIPC